MGRLSKADIDTGITEHPNLDPAIIERYKELKHVLDDMGYGYGWDVKLAAVIALAEHGYSASGISGIIVNGADLDRPAPDLENTVGNWKDKAEDEFNWQVIHAHPKSEPVDELWPDGYNDPYK